MKIPCKITFLKEVANDLAHLDDNHLQECKIKLAELKSNIHLGKPLEDKNGMDLEGCYKIYFDNARYRIVYRKIDVGYEIIGVNEVSRPIAEIIAIGQRNKQQVYKAADDRINK